MNVVLSFFKFGEFTMIVCPKCGSDKFYYKMRVWEFHVVDNIDDGKVELLDLHDSYIDLSMNPFFSATIAVLSFLLKKSIKSLT